MREYYERRAPEYEAIYDKPERQDDLAWLEAELLSETKGCLVLELACGTGYWTRRMASVATAIRATDVSLKLAVAAAASARSDNVSAAAADIYSLPNCSEYDCVVGGFIYSHVPCMKRQQFWECLRVSLGSGGRVVLFDNKYVPGSSSAISKRSDTGDTFQVRRLADGSEHEVIKNFPDAEEIATSLQSICSGVEVKESKYFWFATGVTDGPLPAPADV